MPNTIKINPSISILNHDLNLHVATNHRSNHQELNNVVLNCYKLLELIHQ